MSCKDCLDARAKFRKGDRVALSRHGCRQLPELIMKKSRGTVVGFGHGYNCVRILIAGQKTPGTWHSGFWERI
jgi:hypothetical protein